MTPTAFTTLEEMLRKNGEDELCFEINAHASPSACFRSSNSAFLVPVPLQAAEAVLEEIKSRARLDPSTLALPQSGLASFCERIYRVNYCPQGDDRVIVVFHRYFPPAPTAVVADLPCKWTHWKLVGDGKFIAAVDIGDVLRALRVVDENYGRYTTIRANRATVDENGQVKEEEDILYDLSNLFTEEMTALRPRGVPTASGLRPMKAADGPPASYSLKRDPGPAAQMRLNQAARERTHLTRHDRVREWFDVWFFFAFVFVLTAGLALLIALRY